MFEGDWISQTGPMVPGGDWAGLEAGAQREGSGWRGPHTGLVKSRRQRDRCRKKDQEGQHWEVNEGRVWKRMCWRWVQRCTEG